MRRSELEGILEFWVWFTNFNLTEIIFLIVTHVTHYTAKFDAHLVSIKRQWTNPDAFSKCLGFQDFLINFAGC